MQCSITMLVRSQCVHPTSRSFLWLWRLECCTATARVGLRREAARVSQGDIDIGRARKWQDQQVTLSHSLEIPDLCSPCFLSLYIYMYMYMSHPLSLWVPLSLSLLFDPPPLFAFVCSLSLSTHTFFSSFPPCLYVYICVCIVCVCARGVFLLLVIVWLLLPRQSLPLEVCPPGGNPKHFKSSSTFRVHRELCGPVAMWRLGESMLVKLADQSVRETKVPKASEPEAQPPPRPTVSSLCQAGIRGFEKGWREGVGDQPRPKYSKKCPPELCSRKGA